MEDVMVDQQVLAQESFTVRGDDLVDRIKDLIHEGNVRRIIIRREGNTLLELPLTVGVIGAALAPMLAAVAALAALLTECTIDVERRPEEEDAAREPSAHGDAAPQRP
jgi:hypothetical protein